MMNSVSEIKLLETVEEINKYLKEGWRLLNIFGVNCYLIGKLIIKTENSKKFADSKLTENGKNFKFDFNVEGKVDIEKFFQVCEQEFEQFIQRFPQLRSQQLDQ